MSGEYKGFHSDLRKLVEKYGYREAEVDPGVWHPGEMEWAGGIVDCVVDALEKEHYDE